MNILAVDTSGAAIGVAAVHFGENGDVAPLAVLGLPEARQLSRHLIAAIDAVLESAGWTLADVEALAVGLGPGSWTGLRIGLTTCKTLAQARNWQLAGVPTFDAMAQAIARQAAMVREDDEDEDEALTEFESDEPIENNADDVAGDSTADGFPPHFLLLATAPCRAGEIYGKIYECESEYLTLVQAEWIGSPQMMSDTLETEALARGVEGPLVLVGPGATAVSELLEQRQQAHFVVSLEIENLVVEVALAGVIALMQGEAADPLQLQPLYLAPSAAERNLIRTKD